MLDNPLEIQQSHFFEGRKMKLLLKISACLLVLLAASVSQAKNIEYGFLSTITKIEKNNFYTGTDKSEDFKKVAKVGDQIYIYLKLDPNTKFVDDPFHGTIYVGAVVSADFWIFPKAAGIFKHYYHGTFKKGVDDSPSFESENSVASNFGTHVMHIGSDNMQKLGKYPIDNALILNYVKQSHNGQKYPLAFTIPNKLDPDNLLNIYFQDSNKTGAEPYFYIESSTQMILWGPE
jgi:hypothetical protein